MLQQKIKDQIKEAMLAKDEKRLLVLRGLSAAFTNELVALKRKPGDKLSDEEALAVIRRAVKQRQDSVEQFTKGGRPELAKDEEAELEILKVYLPQMMSQDDIKPVVEAKAKEMGVTDLPAQAGKSKAGMLMGAVMSELKGKADGKDVKAVIDSILQ